MLHSRIKNTVRDILMNIGLQQPFTKNKSGARMLLFHGIDDCGSTNYNSRFISSKKLEDLLVYFKQHFHITTLDNFCTGNYPRNKFTITITFDDGLANNYHKTLPILEKHNIPASFFITGIRKTSHHFLWTDLIDLLLYNKKEVELNNEVYKKNKLGVFISTKGIVLKSFLRTQTFENIDMCINELIKRYKFDVATFSKDYYLQMTADEIKELANHPLVTIGSHGMYHTDLTKISLEHAEQEMIHSKNYLEQITGKSIRAFAFPFDIYNEALVGLAKKTGYEFIVPTALQKDENTCIQRFGINPYISFNNQIHFIYKGNY